MLFAAHSSRARASKVVTAAEYSGGAGIVYAANWLVISNQISVDDSFAADPQEVYALAILNLKIVLLITQKIDFVFFEQQVRPDP